LGVAIHAASVVIDRSFSLITVLAAIDFNDYKSRPGRPKYGDDIQIKNDLIRPDGT